MPVVPASSCAVACARTHAVSLSRGQALAQSSAVRHSDREDGDRGAGQAPPSGRPRQKSRTSLLSNRPPPEGGWRSRGRGGSGGFGAWAAVAVGGRRRGCMVRERQSAGAQHTRMKRRCASVLRRRPAVAAPLDMPSWPPEPPVGPLPAGLVPPPLPEDLFFLPLRFPPIALSARYLSRRSLGQVRQLLDRSPPTLPACIVIKERPPGPRSTAPAGVPREERGTAVTIRSVLEQIVWL